MTLWRYSAIPLTATGPAEARSGEISGDSAAAARAALRQVGLQALELRPVAKRSTDRLATLSWWHSHLRARRTLVRAELYDGLATMLESGLPLLEALDTTIRSLPHRRSSVHGMLVQVREGVRSGEMLAETLRPHPGWFDPPEIAMIEAGQHAGSLSEVLRSLTERLEHSGELTNRLVTALTYPSIVAIAGTGVLIFVSTQTLPDLVEILRDGGVEVPVLTRRVMAIGQTLTGSWWILAGGVILGTAGVVGARAVARRYRLEWPLWIRRLSPPLRRRFALAHVSLRLAELLRTGVPIVEALRIVAPTLRNDALRRRILAAADRVEHGEELSAAMDDTLWFDPEFRRLLEVAHASGELEDLLERLGNRYRRTARRQIDRLASLLEPAVILLLAVLIGAVVMAAILPLARLQEIL